jgi:peptidoglycan DL-endopeptidase CwlO
VVTRHLHECERAGDGQRTGTRQTVPAILDEEFGGPFSFLFEGTQMNRCAVAKVLTGNVAPLLAAGAMPLIMAAGWPVGGRVVPAQVTRADPATSALTRADRPVDVIPAGADRPVPGGGGTLLPPRPLLAPDLLVVSARPLPGQAVAKVRGMRGVRAAETVDAARVRVNGAFAAVLGVNPVAFRRFAARPTASRGALWQSVAEGAIAVSYTMGRQAGLPTGSLARVAGQRLETLRVGGLGTVGIAGVDAVVSDAVARSLGFPAGNALVISAPPIRLSALKARIKAVMPPAAVVEFLVEPTVRGEAATGGPLSPGRAGGAAAASGLLSPAQLTAFLKAAVSRVGMPYVWGAAGPTSFDCSGLVQWSLAQAGVLMPRVAADQARTGPAVPISQLQPGDLLFYHTDPTAPDYISHVAIYLGKGLMVQAPEPGMDVQIVPVDLGTEFAGAIAVSPAAAAAAAGNPVG